MNDNRDIFVISDLHMGDGGPRDNFAVGDKEEQLKLFLEFVKKESGELIIIGDLFEFWQASLGKVLVKRGDLIDRLADMGAIFVVGNHDCDLEALIGTDILCHRFFEKMSRRFVRTIGDKKFMFMHGHEVDAYNKGDTPGWGRMAAIFAGICEDINRSPLLDTGETVENWLRKIFRPVEKLFKRIIRLFIQVWNFIRMRFIIGRNTPALNPRLAKKMLHLYKEDKIKEGYDVAVVGHTHKVGKFEDWYFNSGCWVEDVNNFVRISQAGKVEIFDWRFGKAIINQTELSG
jgi:UDP-2,3-diacylglucosamine pyrophosphatase LpxH